MFVIADKLVGNAVVREKFAGMPRIFAGNEVNGSQRLDRSKRDVLQVPDRRGDKIKQELQTLKSKQKKARVTSTRAPA